MLDLMEVNRCFFAPAGEKQARLRSNKTKHKSFHTAPGTLQHAKEHLAPTWTPNGDFCWIIHSEVSNTETVAYLQHRFASPPTSMHYIWISELSVQWCDIRGKYTFTYTCTCAHTHKHTKSNMIPAIPSVLSFGFSWEKHGECRECWWQILLLATYSRLNRQSSSEIFMQEYCREKGVPPTVKVAFSLISLTVDSLIYLKQCGLWCWGDMLQDRLCSPDSKLML